MKNNILRLTINTGLFVSGLAAIVSGLFIQVHYHIGNHGDTLQNQIAKGLNYSDWSDIHKFSICILFIMAVFHVYLHWQWYKTVFEKKSVRKHKQVITLSILFVVVTITGFVPWIINSLEGSAIIRKAFIEIHDKMGIILSVYLILHITKRLKWYTTAFKNIRKE